MKTLIAAALAFIAGILGSDFLIANYRILFGGEQDLRCLPDGNLCVGSVLDETYIGGMYTFDRIGGLDAIFCEDTNPNQIEEELLLVDAIIKGERCEGLIEGFAFRNSTSRTVVIVESGRVKEIRRGSLHTIDL
ncbi:MAG: hypothetical protein RIC52_06455 [Amphiplicatus sp.]